LKANRSYGFDPLLDQRQLFSRARLREFSQDRIELCTARFDMLLINGVAQPHVDLYFHLPESGRLVPALALPIHAAAARMTWPDCFADWPDVLLRRTTTEVIRLCKSNPQLGQIVATDAFQEVFGGTVEQMLDGRSIPGMENYWTTAQVLNRYQWVESLIAKGRVLEVATGPGYGAAWLLERRPGVADYLGVDLDSLAINLARRLNAPGRGRFHLGPLEDLQETGFDWVLSLETIEHTGDPEEFLVALKRKLAPGGRMLLSLPCERWHGFHLNRHHWSAWNYRRIRDFLQPHFGRIGYWRQGRPLFQENALDDTGRITPLEQIDPDRDEDYLMLLEEPREAPKRPRVVVQRRYARGDVLQTTPIIRAVRERLPHHTLVVSTDIDEVFAGNPHVDLLMATSSGFRPRPDDLVIDLDAAYERRPKQHILVAYAEAADVALPDPSLELHLDRRDYQTVGGLLASAGESWQTVSRIAAVHMGATPDRSWPAAHWQTLIAALQADPRLGVIAVGAGADFQPPAAERILNLINRLDLRETAAAIAVADLLIGPDSALLHVAAAVGTPAVGLYGMADPKYRVPFGAEQTALRSPVECVGCLHDLPAPNTNPRCKFGKSFCMEAISPSRVVAAVIEQLDRRAADAWRTRLRLGGCRELPAKSKSPRWSEASGSAFPAGEINGAATQSVANIAAPSAPPPPPTPWLPAGRWLPTEKTWIDETLAEWGRSNTAVPAIALALLPHPKLAAQPTSDSLKAQLFGGKLLPVQTQPDTTKLIAQSNQALQDNDADWLGLIDAGDQLAPDALFRIAHAVREHPQWQIVYTDEDQITADGQHTNPHCKPDFNLDYLRSLPYVGGLLLIRRDLFEALGGFDPQAEGAEDYDLMLRAWEHLQRTGAGEAAVGHVPEVLYHRLQGSGHTHKSVPEILQAGHSALQRHFERLGIAAQVQPGPFPPSFRVRWPLPEARPLVSILVPTRDQLPLLQRCVESVIEKTKYPAYEILIIDNDSQTIDARNYLAAIEAKEAELGGRLRVVRQPGPFNFSAMNNAAARAARGEYLLLLNNDTAALHDDWLDEMMGHAVRPDVGIVGAKLLYPDGKIQHAGVILGLRGPAEHPFIGRPPEDRGYFGRAQLTQDLSAVTGACLLVRKSVYEQVGGLDEQAFKVSYNDIDLCLKVREAGLRIVFTPYALLMHEGSASQKSGTETQPDNAKLKRFAAEKDAMYAKWLPQLAFDPAYNRHLSLASTDFLLDDQPCLSWDPDWRPRPRVLVHSADREGCGEYRIIAPMRALNRAGLTQGWETMRLFEPAEMERMQPDSLVVQRQMEWPQIEALERHARTSKAFRVFEIDDLITNLPHKSVHKSTIHKDIAKRFRKAAGLCNRLVVATEPLAKAYAHFTDEVVVQPNYLEAARWGHLQPARAERSKPRVGWAGGVGHTGDLELIADLVRDTASEVDWVFFGLCPEALKPLVKEFHPGVPLDQYAAKLAVLDLDLAVAPLEDNAFNEAKSHLRLLEYGILGYPVICSDLTPYQGDFPVTRVANRYRDWTRALREAVSDRAALRAQGDALRAKVLADWMMEDHLDTWLKAWLR
jgi:GT2 family glycosyltransferase/ADP-heptose:LPS heptosyltransferase